MSDRYDSEYIDEEERQIAEDLEHVDTDRLSRPTREQQVEIRRTARNTLRKREAKMNIRIDAEELSRLKQRAEREGLRYQTLVKSVLHKYLTGQLVDRSGGKD